MHRAKPFVFVPLGVFLFAAGITATWPTNTIEFWLWATASGVALVVAVLILMTRALGPDCSLAQAVEIILGATRWAGPEPTVPFDRIADVIESLAKSAATERLTIWGVEEALSAGGGLGSAPTKIPADYWRTHQIDLAEFAAHQQGVVETLPTRLREPPSPAAFRNLQFNHGEIKKFKREWRK